MLPRESAFLAAFVFGGKAYGAIMESDISIQIKNELSAARVYAEGRGIKMLVTDRDSLKDIFMLMEIKLAY